MNIKKYEIKDFLEVKSSSSPSFSPNVEKISFLSNITGTYQLYIVSTEGGQPEQITSAGKKAELLVYKDEGHGLSKLKNRLDAYPKIVSFLENIF